MLKKLMSLMLSLMLVVTMIVPTVAFGLTRDYGYHWASDTIDRWLDRNLINGYTDGTFRPDNKITRSEFVALVNRVCNFTQEGRIYFTDVRSGDWDYKEVAKAYQAGYITGISASQFAPNNNLTREEAAVMISRIKKLSDNPYAVNRFTDAYNISSWAAGGVGAAVQNGIVLGNDRGTFEPKLSITRAEAAVMLARAFVGYSENNQQYDDITIDKNGTELKNKTYHNVTISDKVGEGTVNLKDITVTGELYVEGGGRYSVILTDCIIPRLTVNREEGQVRIIAKGDTRVSDTRVNTSVILEESGLDDYGFRDVTVEYAKNSVQTVTIKASIDRLDINSKVKVDVQSGKITNMTIGKNIDGLPVYLAYGATISQVDIDSKAVFTGMGKVELAIINVKNVTFQKAPAKYKGQRYTLTQTSSGGSSSSYLTVTEDNKTYSGEAYDYVTIDKNVKNVTFTDFKINGTLTVNGGSGNSIHFKGNSVINNIFINAPRQTPRIQVEDNTVVKNVYVDTTAIISSASKGTTSFENISVDSVSAAGTQLNNISVNNVKTDANITLTATHVSNLEVTKPATLSMDGASQIKDTVKATASTAISGGKVANLEAAADVNVSGTIVDTIKIVKSTDIKNKVQITAGEGTWIGAVNITPSVTLQPQVNLTASTASVGIIVSESTVGIAATGSGRVETIIATNQVNKANITIGAGIKNNSGTTPVPGVALVVEAIGDLSAYHKIVPYGTTFEQLGLPQTVSVTLKNNAVLNNPQVAVDWSKNVSRYDGSKPGIYTITGILNLTNATVNGSLVTVSDNGIKAKVHITVANDTNRLKSEISNAKKVMEGIATSIDGKEIEKEKKWTTKEAFDILNGIVAAAEIVAKKENAMQSEVDAMMSTVKKAAETFSAGIKYGNKEEIKINAAVPVFDKALESATYVQGETAKILKTNASVKDQGTITYQWYRNENATTEGAIKIQEATKDAYTPSTNIAGTTYYYVIATNTNDKVNGNKTGEAVSSIAGVTIGSGVKYDLNGGSGTTPETVVFSEGLKAAGPNRITAPVQGIFVGWNTSKDGSGTTFKPGDVITNTGQAGQTMTLYATWAMPVDKERISMETPGVTEAGAMMNFSKENGSVSLSYRAEQSYEWVEQGQIPQGDPNKQYVSLKITKPNEAAIAVKEAVRYFVIGTREQASEQTYHPNNADYEETVMMKWLDGNGKIVKTEYVKVKIKAATK